MQNIKYNPKKLQKWFLSQKNPPMWFYDKFENLQLSGEEKKAFQFAHKVFKLFPHYEKMRLRYLDILFWYNYINELLEECHKACNIFPDSFDCKAQLARAYLYNGDAELAAQIFRNAPDVETSTPPWWLIYLAKTEHFLGNSKEAIGIYKQMVTKWPLSLPKIFRELVTYEPQAPEVLEFADKILQTVHDETIYTYLLFNNVICAENGHAELIRQRLSTMLDKLSPKPILISQPEKNRSFMAFEQLYLHDNNINDCVLRKKLASLYMQCNTDITSYSATSIEIKKKTRLRLGVAISRIDGHDFSFFVSILFKNFDTSKFELIFFAEKNLYKNEYYESVCSLFSKVIVYDANKWREYKKLLLSEKLDIYMGETITNFSHSMAFFSRFAPLQINAFDRLTTFGAPHTDYFLIFGEKNKLTEWSKHLLGEKYAILEYNYLSLAPTRASLIKVDYATLNLPKAPYFFYFQPPSRLLPSEDHIFATLLRNNPEHYFFVLTHSTCSRLIWYRWKKIMPDCMNRIKFIRYRQPLPVYLGLISEASAILSSISSNHGGISSFTSLSLGIPIVAGYSNYWGACITKFQYNQMGVEGLVASSHEEYIAIAQRLIDDPAWKAKKSNEIKENFHKIYNPDIAAQEIQDFLIQAYERARLGLKPAHWQKGNFIEHEKIESF